MKHFTLSILLIYATLMNAQTPNEILGLQLDTFIQDQIQQKSIPGLSACIVKGDQVVWKAAYGMANLATNQPVTLQTEFMLASISKLFTATACAQLWESGALDIDVDINNYLPITVINPNFPNTPITIRQLLTHKSSLRDYESDLELWDGPGDPVYDLETFCSSYFVVGASLYKAPNFGATAPGNSSYWYSNAGFTLLGYIVQEVSGLPFNIYVKNHILTPLQMNSAGWFYSEVDSTGLAMPYNNSLQPFGYYSVPEYPSAMLKSNVEELANFLIAYTQGGSFQGNSLVNPATFATLVPTSVTNGFGWWGKDTWYGDPAGNFWSHGGFMNGVRTQLNYYPSDCTGLIILTNGQGSYTEIQNQLESYIPLFEVESTSSIVEENSTSDFNIFPIPATDYLNIERKVPATDHTILVDIYNSAGQKVLSIQSKKPNLSVDVSTFPKGTYFCSISQGEKRSVRKIVLEF